MATAFPALKPVSRSYTPGDFPTRRFDAINGAGLTRLYGNKAFNAQLTLEFIVEDVDLKRITDSWNNAYGSYQDLNLPEQVFSGMDSSVFPNHLKWKWAESPSVNSVRGDLSRVSCKLVGTLELT